MHTGCIILRTLWRVGWLYSISESVLGVQKEERWIRSEGEVVGNEDKQYLLVISVMCITEEKLCIDENCSELRCCTRPRVVRIRLNVRP